VFCGEFIEPEAVDRMIGEGVQPLSPPRRLIRLDPLGRPTRPEEKLKDDKLSETGPRLERPLAGRISSPLKNNAFSRRTQ
jgi:hypothetical protein